MSFVQLSALNDILNRNANLSHLVLTAPAEPEVPVWYPPEAEEPYQGVGKILGMDGNEVQIILDHALQAQNPMVMKALEKFLFIAKLDASEALERYHAHVNLQRANFKNHSKSFQNQKAHWDQQMFSHKERIVEVRAQICRRWNKLINSLLRALEMHPNVNDLSPEDQIALGVLHYHKLALHSGTVWQLEVSALSVLTVEEIVDLIQHIHQAIEPLRTSAVDYPF